MESLPPAYTLPKQNYKSVKRQKKNVQSNAFSSVCIDEYMLILGPYLIIDSKIKILKH